MSILLRRLFCSPIKFSRFPTELLIVLAIQMVVGSFAFRNLLACSFHECLKQLCLFLQFTGISPGLREQDRENLLCPGKVFFGFRESAGHIVPGLW